MTFATCVYLSLLISIQRHLHSYYVYVRTHICIVCILPPRGLSVGPHLPGGSLISARSEGAVSGPVHLPRLQLGGKRDSHDKREDQRSVVA